MNIDIEKTRENIFLFYEDVLSKAQILTFKVKGYSMFPFMKPGDRVLIQSYPKDKFKAGDLILFKKRMNEKTLLIIHRLVKKNKFRNSFFIKSDTSFNFDEPVMSDDVLGKAIGIKKRSKVINLNNMFGRCTNFLFLFFSITYILPLFIKVFFSFRKRNFCFLDNLW